MSPPIAVLPPAIAAGILTPVGTGHVFAQSRQRCAWQANWSSRRCRRVMPATVPRSMDDPRGARPWSLTPVPERGGSFRVGEEVREPLQAQAHTPFDRAQGHVLALGDFPVGEIRKEGQFDGPTLGVR